MKDPRKALTLIEVAHGVRFPEQWLVKTLGDRPKWAVRFGMKYQLDAVQLGALLRLTCPGVDVVQALTLEGGEHSGHLQDYIVGLGYENLIHAAPAVPLDHEEDIPDEGIMSELFELARVQIVETEDQLVLSLEEALAAMPGKEGRMAVRAKMKLDRRSRKLGIAESVITHDPHKPNIVVFDVSGSMGEGTVSRLVDEVVALGVKADAYLAVVSDDTFWWEPGTYTRETVLSVAQYSGTHYETLSELFERDWGVCITVADFDSSWSAKEAIKNCNGSIDVLMDISLVERPTFLAEVLGQLAEQIRPLVVAKTSLTYDY